MMAQWLALLSHSKKGLNLPAGVVQLAFICRACVSSLCVLWLRSKDMQWVQLTASSKLAVDINVRVNLSLC